MSIHDELHITDLEIKQAQDAMLYAKEAIAEDRIRAQALTLAEKVLAVIERHPGARLVRVGGGTVNGNPFEILDALRNRLGAGTTAMDAWKNTQRRLNEIILPLPKTKKRKR